MSRDFLIGTNDNPAVVRAIQKMLRESPPIIDINECKVVRGEPINMDPNVCPWVGVYSLGDTYESRTLGMVSGFRKQAMRFAIIMQESSVESGERAQDNLGVLVKAVTSVILSDTSLAGMADIISDDFNVQYTEGTKNGDRSFIGAVLAFTAEKNVSVNQP